MYLTSKFHIQHSRNETLQHVLKVYRCFWRNGNVLLQPTQSPKIVGVWFATVTGKGTAKTRAGSATFEKLVLVLLCFLVTTVCCCNNVPRLEEEVTVSYRTAPPETAATIRRRTKREISSIPGVTPRSNAGFQTLLLRASEPTLPLQKTT